MTEYMPTTDEVREDYAFYLNPRRMAEFDRWLNEIRAETWYEGFCRGEKSGVSKIPLNPGEWNPYRTNEK